MGLSELAAFEAAYQVLQPLDEASRRRALQWLSDALGESKPLSRTAGDQTVVAASETRGRRQATQPLNGARSGKAVKEAPGRRGRRPGKVKSGGERSYRRMPAAEEVMDAYQQVGTVSGLAEHFDVPVYTVHSWARRLRGQGYQIGRQS
ncbi:hypothetical protein Rhe02_13280 [Rhizocola hellebori]|uniref:Uncharacterized protein n=1 Tax=Rhizocola hellebori TaxID=1392758 RepID=A0A8J3Q4J7_9ACTN|nr:hypothetical protein [Rhizocola hellebori]GIH03261.1 hypothetical protein Rhe02_13280 [Rhizocola hellebori]